MALAASTQMALIIQTQTAGDATRAAQDRAATAAQLAYLANVNQTDQAQARLDALGLQTAQVAATLTAYPLVVAQTAQSQNITQTAQAQLVLNAQGTQSAQAIASLTAFPMTATPFAVTQAALLMQEYGREQQAFMDQIVTPLLPVAASVVLILLIVGIVLAYRRFMPQRQSRRWTANYTTIPVLAIDRNLPLPPMIPLELTPANLTQPEKYSWVHVEIVNAADPPFAHWIEDVERQLDLEEGRLL